MFCSKCGAYANDSAKFCTACGATLSSVQSGSQYTPQEQTAYSAAPRQSIAFEQTEYKMGWYKFLIYFSLFAGALKSLSGGFSMLTGAHYGDVDPELVYSVFAGMQFVDILFGVVLIGIAGFCIYVRQCLSRYRRNGPKMLNYLYITDLSVSLLYLFGASLVSGISIAELIDASTVSSLISSCVMLAINTSYFKKRASLFIN